MYNFIVYKDFYLNIASNSRISSSKRAQGYNDKLQWKMGNAFLSIVSNAISVIISLKKERIKVGGGEGGYIEVITSTRESRYPGWLKEIYAIIKRKYSRKVKRQRRRIMAAVEHG